MYSAVAIDGERLRNAAKRAEMRMYEPWGLFRRYALRHVLDEPLPKHAACGWGNRLVQ
jgi:hypothetical protein